MSCYIVSGLYARLCLICLSRTTLVVHEHVSDHMYTAAILDICISQQVYNSQSVAFDAYFKCTVDNITGN